MLYCLAHHHLLQVFFQALSLSKVLETGTFDMALSPRTLSLHTLVAFYVLIDLFGVSFETHPTHYIFISISSSATTAQLILCHTPLLPVTAALAPVASALVFLEPRGGGTALSEPALSSLCATAEATQAPLRVFELEASLPKPR